jgi:hypothetical protein
VTFGRKEDPAETSRIEAEKMNEVGRELQWGELTENTVVVTNPTWRPDIFMTLWVAKLTPVMVWLVAEALRPTIKLGLFKQPDGTLRDATDRAVKIFEYLGT